MPERGLPRQPQEAMLDLLIKHLTDDLLPEERGALDIMDGALTSAYAQDFERAAAAISVAAFASSREIPSRALRARLEQEAQAFFANKKVTELQSVGEVRKVKLRSASRLSDAGWYAAAACLVLAIFGWLRVPPAGISPPTANVPEAVPSVVLAPFTTPAPQTPAEQRAALLGLPGSMKVNLDTTKDPAAAGVTADVVWDPVAQRGFLRFIGLRSNDPRIQQYQAWIFDAERDKRYPLDAGLFDVPANSSEVIVPLHAKLPVHAAKAFAVTLEKPGGVVVSALHHVVVLGSVT